MATKISLKQLGKDILDYIKNNGGGGDATLTENITSNAACGAAPSGTNFTKGESMTEVMKKLLLKEIYPQISATLKGEGLHKIGDVATQIVYTIKITNLKNVTVPINKIKLKIDGVDVAEQPYVDGQSSYSFSCPNVTSNTKYQGSLIYEETKELKITKEIKFVYPSYVGIVDTISPNDSIISRLSEVIKDTKAYTWSNINVPLDGISRPCYCYPASYGELTKIEDINGYDVTGSFEKILVQIGDANYVGYVLIEPAGLTDFKYVFK